MALNYIHPLHTYIFRLVSYTDASSYSKHTILSYRVFGDDKAVRRIQVILHGIQIAVLELHITGVVFHLNQLLTYIQRHKAVRR